jgi:exoribonuclease-2
MTHNGFDLAAAARQTMIEAGFHPDFPPEAEQQLEALRAQPAPHAQGEIRDLRGMLWSSIDNDTSRDLDQAEVAERVDGGIRVLIAIADVDADVPAGSPIDAHAASETTSVYTGVRVFPMLPEELSTGLTSLNEGEDRLAIVTEFVVDAGGAVGDGRAYRALVRNQAQLAYSSVGAWLEGRGSAPEKVAASGELKDQLNLQDEAAQLLAAERHRMGALNLDRVEAEAVLDNGRISGIAARRKNRATELIENFMVAANGVMARTLAEAGVSSIARVVRTPERWPRIAALAARYGETLPMEPDPGALNRFLLGRRAADPDHYADVSLAVVKLMGPGEYVLAKVGGLSPGHFALAASDYTHSTAPNRRYADTVTQRLIKAVIGKRAAPYSDADLDAVARNCTVKEDAARKVERRMHKRIAAVALRPRVGEMFTAVVTGVTAKGTFVRVTDPPAEGILAQPGGVDVGDKLQVKLVSTDVQRGYLDFIRAR